MTIAYELVTQGPSQSVENYVSNVNAALVAAGPIGLQDVLLTRLEDLGHRGRLRLTLSYTTPGPIQVQAVYFGVTAGSQPPDVQAAAFFAANPLYRALFIRDVGNEFRAKLDADATLVLYATTPLSNCGQSRSRAMIVQALANISPGATGSAQMVSSGGLVAGSVISVVNRFDSTWLAGTNGYATPRAGSCVFDGFKTCC